MKATKHFLKCYEMISIKGLGFGVLGLVFRVHVLGFRVYKDLVIYFNKHLNKVKKILFKMW